LALDVQEDDLWRSVCHTKSVDAQLAGPLGAIMEATGDDGPEVSID
jgi:hypothetical protein